MPDQTLTQTKETLSHIISAFLSARRNLSPNSQEYYRVVLSNFRWYASAHGWPEDPELITRGHIRQFLDYVANESYRWPEARRSSGKKASPATIHHYGKVIKTLFNWAESEEYLITNPLSRLKLAPPRYKEVTPYSDDEVRAMLDVCAEDAKQGYRYLGLRNQAIISLFVATGLRVEELSRIRLSDLNSRLEQVTVMGKGAKMRVVPISREARKALRRYLEVRPQGGDDLWKTGDGKPMSLPSIKVMISRLKRRAGVNSGGGAHRFRHYFATKYLEAGGDLNSLRLLLGHTTLDMVLRYSRYVDIKRALARHDRFDPLDNLYRY